jgi:hypothetical protein
VCRRVKMKQLFELNSSYTVGYMIVLDGGYAAPLTLILEWRIRGTS